MNNLPGNARDLDARERAEHVVRLFLAQRDRLAAGAHPPGKRRT